MIISVFPWGVMGEVIPVVPDFTYTGEYETMIDPNGGWRIRFLTSGTLKFAGQRNVDIFAVGGGGGGMSAATPQYNVVICGGGGAGGQTATESGVTLIADHEYTITIGAGGAPGAPGGTTSMDSIISAQGGQIIADSNDAGTGGCGGGGGSYRNSSISLEYQAGNGGSNGSDGAGAWHPGDGQESTTAEFGETGATLYAGGGGGGNHLNATNYKGGTGGGGDGSTQYSNVVFRATAGFKNTGGGGGGGTLSYGPASGGSGILIIRNART